jgi:phosphoglucosamine mutase
MSNMILVEKLQNEGIRTFRCPVGDRYVVEKMRETGSRLGGEQSGHIIASDYVATGDGLCTSILFMKACRELREDISTLVDRFPRYPQTLRNLRISDRERVMASPALKEAKAQAENKLRGDGRVLIRLSGTEPLLRLLVEARDETLMDYVCQDLERVIMEIENTGTTIGNAD